MVGLLVRKVGGLVCALGLSACGDSVASVEDQGPGGADEGGTGDAFDDSDGMPQGDTEDDDNETAGETGEEGASVDETGSGGEEQDDSGADENCKADCGPNGFCSIDEDGHPECVCDEGSVSAGLRCLPCAETNGPHDVEIEGVFVQLEVLVAGEPAPETTLEDGELFLRDAAAGDEVYLGNTHDGVVAAVVVPGTYELVYAMDSGGAVVPINSGAHLETLRIDSDTEMVVDIPSVELRGSITLGGAEAPDAAVENGELWLVDPASGDSLKLGETRDGQYSVQIIPGDFQIHYRNLNGGAEVPRNGDALLGSFSADEFDDEDGNGEAAVLELDIDVPFVDIAGDIALDGGAPPDNAVENGTISLRDVLTGDEFAIAQTRDGEYDVRVVPSLYDVVYSLEVGGGAVPVNADAVLLSSDLRVEPAFDVSIETGVVSGDFLLDGGPPPTEPGDDAIVSLRDPATGDEIELGHMASEQYARRVIVGDYEVVYGQIASTGLLPENTGAVLEDLPVAGDTDWDIDVQTVTVAGDITLSGDAPPTSEFADGRLYLRNRQTGDSVLLGNTRLGGYTATVTPDDYDLVYVVEAAGDGVPINSEATVGPFDATSGGNGHHVDIPMARLDGAIVLDQGQSGDAGTLLLRDVQTADRFYLAPTAAGGYSSPLLLGTYVIEYHSQSSSGGLPANDRAGLSCFTLTD